MHSKICAGMLAAVVVLAIGCSESPVAPSPTPSAGSAAATSGSAMPGGANAPYGMKGQDVPFSGAVTGEAFFDFDSANVKPSDHTVLGKLARCFTDGALAGRGLIAKINQLLFEQLALIFTLIATLRLFRPKVRCSFS